MKWFWSVMVLLVIATGALLARRGTERAASPPPELIAATQPVAAPPVVAPTEEIVPEVAPVSPPVAAVPTPVVPEASKEADIPAAANAEPVAGARGSVEAPAAPVVPEAASPPGAPEVANAEDLARASGSVDSTPAPVMPEVAREVSSSEPVAGASASEEPKPALFKDQFEIAPSRTKPGENGVTIYDERFPVKGTGTPEDPMEISWEFLVSASETFQPRMGKKRLPERITMLDGKRVRVTGYVAFPIMAASQNELLSMRNMWDGCCIGVPPTPYDALEVKLKGAATGRDRFTAFGTVEGTMKVDPYIKGNWLLGLYLMEDATLSQLKEGGDPGKHGGM